MRPTAGTSGSPRPFRLGLTGSVGMGKSTTAAMFAELGLPVWDADASVHRLYAKGGAAAAVLAPHFPGAVSDGSVSRETLKHLLAQDPARLAQLERLVHPLVAADRAAFLAGTGADILILDVPLLYEKGIDAECDAVLLVTAPADLQRARVLARPGMTEAQLALILSRQMPDAQKRSRADHIVETLSLASTRLYIEALIAHLRAKTGAEHA
ncbi:dephospho-CoA kinase [Xinfangfangia sp. D13-10-4-6]|uniref:dephospho-CoA kinase n=1 Tax=Pseudogemmobacter hezensis TaxID=2737662 RepID=UPI0015534C6C|nr:dephospho-CoA kinase [Pseudogemmobacter hezensis]NPD17360.1 dephospho-CoA kinase [Pseudogemmobacter hezensis]